MARWRNSWLWNFIKSKLSGEGAYNKLYDSQLRGIVDDADAVDGYHLADIQSDAQSRVDSHASSVLNGIHNVIQDVEANLPAAGVAGRLFIATDTGKIYRDNGTSWDSVGGGGAHADTHLAGGADPILGLASSQLGFGLAWEHVASISVTTNVQSISFTGLNGDVDKIYMLIAAIYNTDTTADRGFYLRFNGDTTLANYAYHYWMIVGGTSSSGYQSYNSTTGIAGADAFASGNGGYGFGYVLILAEGITIGTDTFVTVIGSTAMSNGIGIVHYGSGWKKQANVTQIDLLQPFGAFIGAGSKFWLFKLTNV
ncbi:hypothetical protein [Geoglobus acetivorans]|uniref:Phage tail fiber protein n=1 Tax=Geoglobus acetivorans TaxID=565033 RepID=A0A0A7GDI5_GEOAI|nr:Phage tail fiber protein [Geoglobus acetivorans]